MRQRSWVLQQQDETVVRALCTRLGVAEVTARLLVNRGLDNPDRATRFLSKSIDALQDPFLIPDMAAAVERIRLALARGERMTIFGDYDVDGVTATAILHRHLSGLGGRVDYYIPNRNEEGYGLSAAAVERIAAGGTGLLITVDSGITAIEEVAHAARLGMDTIVTDHHECQERLPSAVAVVNPKRPDCRLPFKELAGVGVVFKLICALEGRGRLQDCIDRYVELTAFGTIADVMPLTCENRILVALGINRMAQTQNPGLRALMRCAGIESRRITAGSVGFTLAPRVNAVGRIGCADQAVELFLTGDASKAEQIALALCRANSARQEEEDKILRHALQSLEADPDFGRHKIIVLAEENWHHGIIGIVASRLSDLYHRPSIMVSFDEGGVGKGSGRSVAGFNLHAALEHCSAHLVRFGGHALAAGLTIQKEQFPAFKACLIAYADKQLSDEALLPRLRIDCEIDPADITLETVTDIAYLEPYGMGNPAPLFLCRSLTIVDCCPLSGDKHLRLTLRRGEIEFTAFLFGRSSAMFPFGPGEQIDICCNLDVNTFRGVHSAQVVVKDLRECTGQAARRAQDAALYAQLREGCATGELAARAMPSKSDFVAVYRLFLKEGSMTLREACRRLAAGERGPMEYCRLRVCLDVLEEMGIFKNDLTGERLVVKAQKIQGKVDLNNSQILQNLRKIAVGE
ncbi:MAG: single-stranded-DNA-specific exonuclease RecJ [Clostridiales bacterium]|nr:single-stranded-DNA-specific exonuclease RecJ [Clostridiales bacterium]